MDAGCAPGGILTCHAPNRHMDLVMDLWPSTTKALRHLTYSSQMTHNDHVKYLFMTNLFACP